jgi:uroporphyrin-III C-methyltransferase
VTDGSTPAPSAESAPRIDTPRVLDELSRSNVAPHLPRARSRSSGLRRFLIIMLVLVPVLLAIFWLVYEQLRVLSLIETLQTENMALQQNASATGQAAVPEELLATLADRQSLEALRTSLETRIAALASSTASVEQRLEAEPTPRDVQEWLWTEAEYLLRLANQKLTLQGDADSALLILTTVDEMLRDSGDATVLGVRDALAGEMLALRNLDYVDVPGLYVRMNNLLPLVDHLSLRNTLVQNYSDQLAAQQGATLSADTSFGVRALALLGSIFVWQEWDVAPEALLPPQQEATLKQNLRLMLEQAQLALLMAEQEVYRSSLEKGRDWMTRYFAIDAGAGRTLGQELESLSAMPVTVARPDISGSLALLQQANARRAQSATTDSDGR